MKSFSESYKAAGVDITAGYAAVELMKQHVARTMTPGAIGGLGGFGGLFELDMTGLTHPVLVSGTDGVGTKLKIAFLMDKHDTVGIDCVAMCVNDVITCGAKPLVFLDYIACGKNYPEKIASIVAGVAEGCVQAGAALVGGETAEMPGFYPEQEYDLAGFTVGVVEKSKIIDNTKMQAGDAVIALPSSGVHSNGFSLVRKIFNVEYADIWQHYDELSGTLGETLLTPTKIYVKPVLALMEQVDVRAVSHITGGGFYENIPRALAAGCVAKLEKKSLRMPPIFPLLQKVGKIPERDMFNTFNMGVGMAVVVPGDRADESVRILKEAGEDAYILGEIAKGAEKGVELCGTERCWFPAAARTCRPFWTQRPRARCPMRKSLWCWPQSPACTRWSARPKRACPALWWRAKAMPHRRNTTRRCWPRCGSTASTWWCWRAFCPSWAPASSPRIPSAF